MIKNFLLRVPAQKALIKAKHYTNKYPGKKVKLSIGAMQLKNEERETEDQPQQNRKIRRRDLKKKRIKVIYEEKIYCAT